MSMAIVTTVSAPYLHIARALMNPVTADHPECQRYVLGLYQGLASDTMANAEILRPEDPIPDELERTVQQTVYKPIDYATAFKPLVLRAL
jgi:hypothetical protein